MEGAGRGTAGAGRTQLAILPAAQPECGGMEQSLSAHCCPRFSPTGGRSTASPPGKAFPSTRPVSLRQGRGHNVGKELGPGPQEASCLIGGPRALTSRSFNLWGEALVRWPRHILPFLTLMPCSESPIQNEENSDLALRDLPVSEGRQAYSPSRYNEVLDLAPGRGREEHCGLSSPLPPGLASHTGCFLPPGSLGSWPRARPTHRRMCATSLRNMTRPSQSRRSSAW